MKKMHLKSILLFAMLNLTLTSIAQQPQEVEYRSPYRDLRPISCTLSASRNSNGEYHGDYSLKGSDNLKSGQRTDLQQYAETRHYSHGIPDGRLHQSYSHSGSGQISGRFTICHNWSVDGTFDNGIPTGTWTFDVQSKFDSYADKSNTRLREKVVFEDGRVSAITDQDGNYISVTHKGISGTGTLKDGTRVILTNSIVTNTYIDLTGDLKKLNNEQSFLLSKLLDGEWSIYQLADHGYAIDWKETFLAQWARYAEHADRYAHLADISPRFHTPSYSVRLGQLREINLIDDDKAVEYYRQRPSHFYEMMANGCFQGPYGKRYFGSRAALMIQQAWAQNQREVIGRKLSQIARIQDNDSWEQCLIDCAEGNSPLLDLIAFRHDDNSSPNDTYREAARLYKEKFTDLYPIVGHSIDSISWMPQQGVKAQCIIYRMAKDSVGYESYAVTLQTDMDGYLLIGRMEPATYHRISNIWDTIYQYESNLTTRHQSLIYKMGTIKTWRQPYAAHFEDSFADRTNMPDIRMADLRDLDSLQQVVEFNIPLLSKIDQQHAKIRNSIHQYKRLTLAYLNYYDEFAPVWDDTSDRLQELIDFQQQLLRAIAKSDMPAIERKARRTHNPLNLLTDIDNGR